MKALNPILAAFCLMMFMPSFAASAEEVAPAKLGKIAKVHAVGEVFLAGQPDLADLEQAKKEGIQTVINLRHAKEIKDFDEQKAVTSLGMAYEALPWNGEEELTDAVFDRSRELLKTAKKPLLLHCASANRAGAVWLPYRVLDGGLSYDEALAEAKKVGLNTAEYQAKAKEYIRRHQNP